MDKRTVVTAVLCVAAALGASAAMTKVVPPAEGKVSAQPKAGATGGAATKSPSRSQAPKEPQLSGTPGASPGTGSPAPAPATTPAPGGAATFTGALFAGGLDGDHFCTATVVRSPGRNLIVTAGHCLLAGTSGAGGAVFAPAYANGQAPYGTWKLEEVYEDARWSSGGDKAYDLAFARLAPDASGREIEDLTGGAELDASGRAGEKVTVTGYPADRKVSRTCTAAAVRQGTAEQRFDCADFPGGTSGSAWIAGDGKIIGVLTGGDTDDVSTSPVFGPYAAELYAKAVAGSRRG
ncbi:MULTISPECIES: serine protease [unclassified Streptomyces]|uniref:trypsin-like serine peptidase n=1 Tax=unclassified Streptomyces TaxID=2593676 RepID=UPI002253D291|nr:MULTISPECIES: trypsin-like serine protease [unclassified Streptomyces]MCX4526411.1 trypsin-like serine protease [Streptomyces sp. NBC_01551]MCX4543026.1 trypsin-like serine protease [Streptomyces sp. NBC_01565]